MPNNKIDILEENIRDFSPQVLKILLQDKTTKENIIWATDNYVVHGVGYSYTDQITIGSITGAHSDIVKPRTEKTKEEQSVRIRDKAEVFTPSWVCNKQNNLVDNAWFGCTNIFNIESDKGWKATKDHIPFPTQTRKTWQDYVSEPRLEISCGEAPYLVSRFDTVSGKYIDIPARIGLLDRKLCVLSENVEDEEEWINWAYKAFKSIYGYDWHGDNVLLARENLLFTFIDYYSHKFQKHPSQERLLKIAAILVWNIWQMDGLKFVIPNSCIAAKDNCVQLSFFGEKKTSQKPCEGCIKNDPLLHTGIYCKIKDWNINKSILFVSLLKKDKGGKS